MPDDGEIEADAPWLAGGLGAMVRRRRGPPAARVAARRDDELRKTSQDSWRGAVLAVVPAALREPPVERGCRDER